MYTKTHAQQNQILLEKAIPVVAELVDLSATEMYLMRSITARCKGLFLQ